MTNAQCPSLQELQEYLTESPQAEEARRVEEHLDQCRWCVDRLERLYRPVTPPSGEMRSTGYRSGDEAAYKMPLTSDSGEFFLNRLKSSFPRQLPSQIGPYQVLRLLAEGGAGDVFECRDTRLNRRVAVKTIRPQMLKHRVLERLNQEAKIQGVLSHDNIVPLHDFGSNQDGIPYLVMEMIDGGTLGELLREKPLAPLVAAKLMETCARAVHYAHEKGVLHRDLKPSNILIANPRYGRGEKTGVSERETLVPKITDFGLAKLFDEGTRITQSGTVLGTPAYMSPEQAAGGNRMLGKESDVYALGVILYECLTGRPPFQSDSVASTLRMIQESAPVTPRVLLPGLSKDLETICLKCLEKEPLQRYRTAEALADDLQRYQEGKPILARPISDLAKTWRWCRRNPVVAISLLFAFVSIAALTGGMLHLANRRERLDEESLIVRNHATEFSREMINQSRRIFDGQLETDTVLINSIYDLAAQFRTMNGISESARRWERFRSYYQADLRKWISQMKGLYSRIENDFDNPEVTFKVATLLALLFEDDGEPGEAAAWKDRALTIALNFPANLKMDAETITLVYRLADQVMSESEPGDEAARARSAKAARMIQAWPLSRLEAAPDAELKKLVEKLAVRERSEMPPEEDGR